MLRTCYERIHQLLHIRAVGGTSWQHDNTSIRFGAPPSSKSGSNGAVSTSSCVSRSVLCSRDLHLPKQFYESATSCGPCRYCMPRSMSAARMHEKFCSPSSSTNWSGSCSKSFRMRCITRRMTLVTGTSTLPFFDMQCAAHHSICQQCLPSARTSTRTLYPRS
jgi:hypothetical protein